MKILSTVRAQLKCSTSRIPCVSCSPSPILEFPSPQLEVDPYLVKHNFHVRALSPSPKIHQNILGTALYHLVCSLKRKMLEPRGRYTESTLGLGPWNQPFKRGPKWLLGHTRKYKSPFPQFRCPSQIFPGQNKQAQWRPEGELSSEVLLALSDQ